MPATRSPSTFQLEESVTRIPVHLQDDPAVVRGCQHKCPRRSVVHQNVPDCLAHVDAPIDETLATDNCAAPPSSSATGEMMRIASTLAAGTAQGGRATLRPGACDAATSM